MSKFKVGDKVIPVNLNVNMGDEKYWEIKGIKNGRYKVGRSFCWKEEELKLYEDKGDVMSKTFKEVISDIKEGEFWENNFKKIWYEGGRIKVLSFKKCDVDNMVIFDDTVEYTLQRKKVSFTEAFKAYEEGKEIESCVSCRKINLLDDIYSFNTNEIKGEWYINEWNSINNNSYSFNNCTNSTGLI